jgi:eukaryotic-like serine/threonine-protein kinase
MQFWNELEGQTIDGAYPLRRLVRSEGRSAWFETENDGQKATISLTEALTDADEVAGRLEAAHNLSHPNLVRILKIGQVRVDNTLIVYALMEPIEQSLSDVLQIQALTPEEGREVAEALVGALTAIHQQGLSHGRVEAASVLATEDTVKLRSDCLHTTTAGQADDVAAIGPTLFHAFTQRKGLTATDTQINRIPAPFGEIIRNSFTRRWNLAQITNALKPALPAHMSVQQAIAHVAPPPRPTAPLAPPAPSPRAPATPPPPPAPAAAPPAPPPAPPPPPRPPIAAEAGSPGPKPPIAERLVTPPIPVATTILPDDEEPEGRKKPWALYGALAVVVLAILGWLIFRPHSEPPPATTQTQTAPATPSVTSAPAEPPVAAKPAASRPAASVPTRKTQPALANSAPPANGHTIWRVVAYTYLGQTKAQDMVTTISDKHPDLGAAVYNPPGRNVYLVTVGGPLDHDAAIKMRDKAEREGLPHDTYIQNFSH